jgi:PiT family inorganic phosphate transporter
MGVITLALIADGKISAAHFYVPFWVKIMCALAISAGTMIGGWRIRSSSPSSPPSSCR